MFHLFSSTFLIEIHQAQWRPTRLPRRSPVGLWTHKIAIVRCEKLGISWVLVLVLSMIYGFSKRRRIPQKNIWQKGDSPLWQRKLFVLVCVHLSKLKRRPNNSIVNLDLCFHLSSTVMSCHHAAPLVRQNPHGCFGRFSSGGWWSHPRTTKLGGSRTRETMGKTGDLGFH